MIFNRVISSTIQNLCYFCPFVADSTVIEIKDPFLFITPSYFLNFRVEMIVPPFSALFTNSSRKMFSDLSPFLRTVCLYQLQNKAILLFCPGPFDEAWI